MTHPAVTAVLSAFVAVASAAVVVVAGSNPDDREAAGVFPPWWSREDVFAAAGRAGMVRDLGVLPFIAVVHDPGGRVEARLRAAGALFSFAPEGSAACGSGGSLDV